MTLASNVDQLIKDRQRKAAEAGRTTGEPAKKEDGKRKKVELVRRHQPAGSMQNYWAKLWRRGEKKNTAKTQKWTKYMGNQVGKKSTEKGSTGNPRRKSK